MTSYTVAFLSPDPVTIYLSSAEMSQLSTDEDSLDCKNISFSKLIIEIKKNIYKYTWKIDAPYGVRHAFSKLSFPVETNHFPHAANFKLSTQLSCKWSWYLSGLLACKTSTLEFSIPTANQSPIQKKKNQFVNNLLK